MLIGSTSWYVSGNRNPSRSGVCRRRAVGGEVDQRRVSRRDEVAALDALDLEQIVDLGSRPPLDDRDVRHLRRGRGRGQDLQHRAVGHALLEVVRAGPHVPALAGQRRPQVEEEARGDDSVSGQFVADVAGGRVRRDRHRHAPVRRAVERLVELEHEPDHPAGEGEREHGKDSAPPLPRSRWARRAPALGGRPALRRTVRSGGPPPAGALPPRGPRRSARIRQPGIPPRHRATVDTRATRPVPHLAWLASQPALQQVCGRARVLVGPAPGPLRQAGREALVVELDRDRQLLLQASRERARLDRLRGIPAGQRHRQSHHNELGAELPDERAQAR